MSEDIIDDFIPLSHAQAEMSALKAQVDLIHQQLESMTGALQMAHAAAKRRGDQVTEVKKERDAALEAKKLSIECFEVEEALVEKLQAEVTKLRKTLRDIEASTTDPRARMVIREVLKEKP